MDSLRQLQPRSVLNAIGLVIVVIDFCFDVSAALSHSYILTEHVIPVRAAHRRPVVQVEPALVVVSLSGVA